MELELKYLAAYLPHKVKRRFINYPRQGNSMAIDLFLDASDLVGEDLQQIRIVLKPMSKLTPQELEDAGFATHIDFLTKELYSESTKNRLDYKGKPLWRIGKVPYEMVEYLLSQHYDIFDLISKGLAVEK